MLERGPNDRLLGSTGHAPGFVGLLNEVPVVSALEDVPRSVELRWRPVDRQATLTSVIMAGGFDSFGGFAFEGGAQARQV